MEYSHHKYMDSRPKLRRVKVRKGRETLLIKRTLGPYPGSFQQGLVIEDHSIAEPLIKNDGNTVKVFIVGKSRGKTKAAYVNNRGTIKEFGDIRRQKAKVPVFDVFVRN